MLLTLSNARVFLLSYLLLLRRTRAGRLPALSADPVGDAVAEGAAAGFAYRAPSCSARLTAQRARDNAFALGDSAHALATLLLLVRDYPADEVLQRIVARVLGEIGERKKAALAWEGIVARFPQSREAFLGLVMAVARQSGFAAARSQIAARFCIDPATFDNLLTVAKAWDAIGDLKKANAAYQAITTLFDDHDDAWSETASRLEAQGFYRGAAEVLARAAARRRPARQHLERLAVIEDIISHLPARLSRDKARSRQRRSLAVLGGLLSQVVAARNEVLPAINSVPGSIVMIIGGLGAGGAERQLLNTARGLRALCADPQRPPFNRITVVAESCRSRKHGGFFRPQLRLAGVPVVEYEELPLFGGRFASSAVRPIAGALRYLPLPMLRSVLKLSDALRLWRPEVVQIWQEPTVFEAALAALLARVPRIILCLRSVPAIDRPERYRCEYPLVFNALLAARGVELSCNSRYAAGRYSQWLGIDPARITIIPNGVARLPADGDKTSDALFQEFDARTGHSRLTVGVVMRMDENKRPLLWVAAAASLLEQMPTARFILVGDGRLRRQTMKWVEQHGIADRFLFVGLSRNVGFWLSKMDIFMLLSKHEGLPNAVIEAQLAGVPVVMTPAAGAPEAVIAGVTGIVTEPNPSAEDIAATVMKLVNEPNRLRQMGRAAGNWAVRAFSMAQMLRGTLTLMAGGPGAVSLDPQRWRENRVVVTD